MSKIFLYFLVFISLPAFCCNLTFDSEVEIIKNNSYQLNLSDYIFDQEPVDSIDPNSKLAQFQNWVLIKTNPDPIVLLKKQRDIFRHVGFPDLLFNKIIDGEVGEIKRLDCLIANLVERHFNIRNSYTDQTEFLAFLLYKEEKSRIYLIASDHSGVTIPEKVIQNLKKDLKNDWELTHNLHLHPFSFDNPYGDISGTLIPSAPDIQTYINQQKEMGLQNAIITNGFDFILIKEDEFNSL